MKSFLKTATWLTVAALLVVAVSDNVQAQTRVFRPANVARPIVVRPAQPFPTVGNPQWYRYTNWSGYSNPNNYVNYSNLAATTYVNSNWGYNPWYTGYSYNPYGYGYNSYGYNPYAYNLYGYGGYNPYAYVPNPYYTPYAY
jgi:hypothetical protein